MLQGASNIIHFCEKKKKERERGERGKKRKRNKKRKRKKKFSISNQVSTLLILKQSCQELTEYHSLAVHAFVCSLCWLFWIYWMVVVITKAAFCVYLCVRERVPRNFFL